MLETLHIPSLHLPMIPLDIRPLQPDELKKIYEIDRSEEIDHMYRQTGSELESYECNVCVHSDAAFWDSVYEDWDKAVHEGGSSFGAFDGDHLAGFALLKHELEPGVAQIMALYVSISYRLSGTAKSLFWEIQEAAKAANAKKLYVSATPTDSSVKFYLSQDFKPTATPNADLFKKEPEDIHMVKVLASRP